MAGGAARELLPRLDALLPPAMARRAEEASVREASLDAHAIANMYFVPVGLLVGTFDPSPLRQP